jgi:hypothetical protein
MEYFLGQPIEIEMSRFILGQVFGVLTLVFNFWAYQMDDQRKYFLRFAIGSAFWLAMYITMGAQVPVMLVAIFSTLRGFVFFWALSKDSPWRRMFARRAMYGTLVIAFIASVVVIPGSNPGTHWMQIFLLFAVLGFVVGQYMPGVYFVRIAAIVYAVAVILLNTPLDTFNPMGIIIELNNLLAVAVFFYALNKKNVARRAIADAKPAALSLGTPVFIPQPISAL